MGTNVVYYLDDLDEEGLMSLAEPFDKVHSTTTEGKLILFVSNLPSADDVEAKAALLDFDPTVEVREVVEGSMITPRLDAIEFNSSRYRGCDSILGFISQQKRKKARK